MFTIKNVLASKKNEPLLHRSQGVASSVLKIHRQQQHRPIGPVSLPRLGLSSRQLEKVKRSLSVRLQLSDLSTSEMLTGYQQRLPILIITAACLFMLGWIVFHFSPQAVRHVVLRNSFLPVLVFVFVGASSFWIFLLHHTRRGALMGIFCGVIAWFALNEMLNWFVVGYLLFPIVICESFLTFTRRK